MTFTIYIRDFNTSNGITTDWINVYGSNTNRASGQFTINKSVYSNLVPGGVYILEMASTSGSIIRFVQLPYNTSENLVTYSGNRVTARLEAADMSLASQSNVDTWLDRMDRAYNSYKELTGYTPHNSQKITMQSSRENLNETLGVTDGHNWPEKWQL